MCIFADPAKAAVAASEMNAALRDAVREKRLATLLEPSQSSVGRDVARGRRSEIDFTNGLVADKGAEVGVPAPTHAALTALVRQIDRGELQQDPKHIEALPLAR